MNADDFARLRQSMIAEIAEQAIYVSARIGKAAFSQRVMQVMDKVPRHAFVPAELQQYAYANTPLPIGFDKTISQPFIVALMTDLLDIQPTDTVLEVGTGLGYQAAIVGAGAKVYSIEPSKSLGAGEPTPDPFGLHQCRAQDRQWLSTAGRACALRQGDRDRRADLIPPPLIDQLKPGGKMAIPAGLPDAQQLILIEKDAHGSVTTKDIIPVRFSQLEGSEPNGSARIAQ
jgi:protein-L-isoaspartate(D-aspartate) O-methyltransferase